MKRREKKVVRRSVGFAEAEWTLVTKALQIRYGVQDVSEWVNPRELGHFFCTAIIAIASAVVRQRVTMAPLACDLREETPEEMAERFARNKWDWLKAWRDHGDDLRKN